MPDPLVEKNGSTARASVCAIHADAGVEDRHADIVARLRRFRRALRGLGCGFNRDCHRRGIASRALIARLRIASSSWLGSTSAGGRSGSQLDRGPRSSGRPSARADRACRRASRRCRPAAAAAPGGARRRAGADQCLRAVAACSASAISRVTRRSAARRRLQQIEIADDRGQQIVEVVRDAAGQLAQRLQLLRLVQLGERDLVLARALLDPRFEGLVRGRSRSSLCCSSSSRARASYCRRRPRSADCARLTKVVGWNGRSRKVTLPSTSRQPPGVGIALQPAAALGQQDERESPTIPAARRSTRDKRAQIAAGKRLLGDQREAGAGFELRAKRARSLAQIAAQIRASPSIAARDRRIAPLRREDQRAFGSIARCHSAPRSSSRVARSTSSGTPRSTPWKSISGSPERDPALADAIFADRVFVRAGPLLDHRHRPAHPPERLEIAQQDDRVGEIGDVDRRLHVADQAVLGDGQEGRGALAVQDTAAARACAGSAPAPPASPPGSR